MAKQQSQRSVGGTERKLSLAPIVSIEPMGERPSKQTLSTTAHQRFEQLRANPGDQLRAASLMDILCQLPYGSRWHRLDRVVIIYQLGYALRLNAHLDRYSRLDSLKTVLKFDNLYKYKDGADQKEKIYSHQRRLGAPILERASRELSKQTNLKKIARCQSFDELLHRVEFATRHIHPFGTLAVYDTSLRIGAKLGISPEYVYLHAGAMKGYKNLVGTRVIGQNPVRLDDFPKEVQVLEPHHAENFLCIFKGLFKNIGSGCPGRRCC